MDIQKAELNDAKLIFDLVTSLADYFLTDTVDSYPKWFADTLSLNAFEKRLTNEEYQNYLYVLHSDIAGYISVKNESHIYHLFVDKAHHRKGIARKLWEHVLDINRHKHFTVNSSEFAIPVYKSFGFRETGTIQEKAGIRFQAMALDQEHTKTI